MCADGRPPACPGRKRRIANRKFAIREMQHCGALMTRARGAQSLKPFATTLHDVCGGVGWQQNPPFDHWHRSLCFA
eukprot:7118305-Prymnesium_polylepis.2